MAHNGMTGIPRNDFYMENDRAYGTFRRGCYLLPCDATERDRMDVMHTLFKTVRDKDRKLINAPFRAMVPTLTGQRSRILDLGCGTGIWLLEMAEKFPEAELLGIDLNTMGPDTLLPNVDIRVPVDYESPWTLGEGSWDLIHLQMGLGSVAKWSTIYQKIFRHLRPGSGWLESVEIDFTPRTPDGTLARPSPLHDWWEHISSQYHAAGRPITYNPYTEGELRQNGFVDIHHQVLRLPLSCWPSESQDKYQHRAGNWYNIAMSSGHNGNGCHGLEAMSMAVLARAAEWPAQHVRRFCDEVMAQASDPRVHIYNELHIYIARRP